MEVKVVEVSQLGIAKCVQLEMYRSVKDCTLPAKINGSCDWLRTDPLGEAHNITNTTTGAVQIAGQTPGEEPGQVRETSTDRKKQHP